MIKTMDVTIATQLKLGFGVMVGLLVLLGSVSVGKTLALQTDFDLVMNDRYPKITQVHDIQAALNDTARAMRNLFIMSDAQDLRSQHEEIAHNDRTIGDKLERLSQEIQSEQGKQDLAHVTHMRAAYKAPRDRMLALLQTGGTAEAKSLLLQEVRPAQLQYMTALDALIAYQNHLMLESGERVAQEVKNMLWTVGALIAMALTVALLTASKIIRLTSGSLNKAVTAAQAVAEGDLTVQFSTEANNEVGRLLKAVDAMKNRLLTLVLEVEQVAKASKVIAEGSLHLSGNAEQHAAALEESAASMEELSATVKLNADHATQANGVAQSAADVARQGGKMMLQFVNTMQRIEESARRIGDIISVIDGIAFQTNILALNAAVESARAGEHGQGFAVVATEVRTLAQRSADAAKEIKTLIHASMERVEQGGRQVNEAGATMDELLTSIEKVVVLIKEISAASREQSVGVTQVGESIMQMDVATQRNAAVMQESAAAAMSLRNQALHLLDSIAVFKR